MCPEYTKDVADCFPELLPALVSMVISADDVQSSALVHKDIIHKLNCVILGKLIDINQDLLMYVLIAKIYIYLMHCVQFPCNELPIIINLAYDTL